MLLFRQDYSNQHGLTRIKWNWNIQMDVWYSNDGRAYQCAWELFWGKNSFYSKKTFMDIHIHVYAVAYSNKIKNVLSPSFHFMPSSSFVQFIWELLPLRGKNNPIWVEINAWREREKENEQWTYECMSTWAYVHH